MYLNSEEQIIGDKMNDRDEKDMVWQCKIS